MTIGQIHIIYHLEFRYKKQHIAVNFYFHVNSFKTSKMNAIQQTLYIHIQASPLIHAFKNIPLLSFIQIYSLIHESMKDN